MENKKEEFISRLYWGSFDYLPASVIEEYLAKPLSSVKRKELSGLYERNNLVLDLGDGHGMELLTKRVLPLVGESTLLVGSVPGQVVYNTTLFISVEYLDFTKYMEGTSTNSSLSYDDVQKNYEVAQKEAQEEFSKASEKIYYANLSVPTYYGYEEIFKRGRDSFMNRYLSTAPISSVKNEGQVIVRFNGNAGSMEELLTGQSLPVIFKDVKRKEQNSKVSLDENFGAFFEIVNSSHASLEDICQYVRRDKKEIEAIFANAIEHSQTFREESQKKYIEMINEFMDAVIKDDVQYRKSE